MEERIDVRSQKQTSSAVATNDRSGIIMRLAVAAFAIQSVISIAILLLVPDLADSPIIWTLWAFVAFVSLVAYGFGRRSEEASLTL